MPTLQHTQASRYTIFIFLVFFFVKIKYVVSVAYFYLFAHVSFRLTWLNINYGHFGYIFSQLQVAAGASGGGGSAAVVVVIVVDRCR